MNKRIISLILCAVLIASAFAGCRVNNAGGIEEADTTELTTTTTTQPTTVTTTEDTATTFPEDETRKIYKGLAKDTEGSYPYKIAEYTTHYDGSNVTRTANLRAAAEKIDDIVIPDSRVFSFNQTVGKRTVTAGYDEAKIIKDGEFVDGLGGGVCQVSSTIFECVLRANAKIVSRAAHSLEISYVPLGGDATVQWNSCDFQFENTLGCPMKLKMSCGNGTLTCTAYAKKDVDVGDIDISISRSGDTYSLRRTVNGKVNYTTHSKYSKPKTTTKKENTTKKKEKKKDKKKDKKADKKKTEKKKTTKKKKKNG